MANERWQVHVLSFEGPDAYSRAGGIASRVAGLATAASTAGCDTHLWFIGDPALPGDERWEGVTLHRWGQWISRYHPGGVYDGEEGKRADYVASLPPYLVERFILPHLGARDHRVAVLAEEWQTVDAVLHLDWLLARAGARERVAMLWNANNTFGFDRVDWPRLARACTLSTVSRYMRQRMWSQGVDAIVIPNGIPADVFERPASATVRRFRKLTGRRPVLSKVARWDPDKRWLLAVDTVAEMKRRAMRPLLIARGGVEAHGGEVRERATRAGLRVSERALTAPGAEGLMDAVRGTADVDVLVLTSRLDRDASQLLFAASSAVLANSGHEPFGLVGLEAMAAGGVACVGGTGEDYAVPGWNALVLQSADPREFVSVFNRLAAHPDEERALRRNALATAKRFAWPEVVRRVLLPRLAAAVPPVETPSPAPGLVVDQAPEAR
ncbi:MAG: glycosyltransferase family 4 protein, partial [Gemmatimonadota bacterium]|nr:glycosyltransferase family 4 protein [Gemmatimonadota bacterium]